RAPREHFVPAGAVVPGPGRRGRHIADHDRRRPFLPAGGHRPGRAPRARGSGGMSDSRAVARLLAHEQIRQLAARYAVATDARDLDTLVSLFVDDVRVGRDASGRAALKEFFTQSLRDVGVTILNVGTHLVDLDADDPDRASGVVYCRAEIQDG